MASIMDLLMESLGLERRAPVIRAFTIDIASGKFDPENDDHCFYEQMVYEGTGIELDTNWRVDTFSVSAISSAEEGISNCKMFVLPLEERIISIEVDDRIDFDEAEGLLADLLSNEDDSDFLADGDESDDLEDLGDLDEYIAGLDVLIDDLKARLAAAQNQADQERDDQDVDDPEGEDDDGWDDDEDDLLEADDLEANDSTGGDNDESDLEKGDDQSR